MNTTENPITTTNLQERAREAWREACEEEERDAKRRAAEERADFAKRLRQALIKHLGLSVPDDWFDGNSIWVDGLHFRLMWSGEWSYRIQELQVGRPCARCGELTYDDINSLNDLGMRLDMRPEHLGLHCPRDYDEDGELIGADNSAPLPPPPPTAEQRLVEALRELLGLDNY